MPKVEVRSLGPVEEFMGGRKVWLDCPEDATMEDLLGLIVQKGGERLQAMLYPVECNGERNPWVRILLNGRDIRFLSSGDLLLQDGAIIHVMPVLGGG